MNDKSLKSNPDRPTKSNLVLGTIYFPNWWHQIHDTKFFVRNLGIAVNDITTEN